VPTRRTVKVGEIAFQNSFILAFAFRSKVGPLTDDAEKLTPAAPEDIADSISFALLFSGPKRVHDSDRMTASIAAQRIVRHLERCGYVVLKKPPIGGSAPLNPPPGWPHTSRENLK
jgi:hypothetical protein